ncbi:hypothetical protein BDA96_03G389800 [Sorghum bicolor]|uniref:RanBP2-type domain-containing protein n=2 Tax=Sorghum bicolor TaxID=4558 RepID=A0A921RI27_SORBI|nr:serine/arginine repetitive matrix protein 1 [Sorghum bicolor]KAG0540215.1 hypothetical protein BDA96_03G389800 [Sorghum bicolor]KXG33724.1 hypothetical protein SORBI_3003G361500 [Sorghum bicolor]|eukprot:XP_002456660.2 serine/arginine repetitive matrix protein 1 [Sorghum bicolor]
MRPRGRGDDVEDDDDEDEYEDITPPRRTPEPEADPAPAPDPSPSPSPAPAPAPAPPQPARAPLSSLVVRPPPPQENGGGSSPHSPSARSPSPSAGRHRGRGASSPRRRRDFSPPPPRGWERRRSPPPQPPERRRPGSPPPQRRRFTPPPRFQPPRHPRFHDEQQGYGMHAGPSPPRPRRAEASKFDDDVGPRYTHGYHGGGRGGARFREGSPPYGRGGRSYGRGYGAPHGKDFINIDGQYVHRNDPNLSPREGDWICQNPNCGNLNFARRTHCNNCNKFRYSSHEAYEPRRSPPFRGYPSSPRGPPRIGPPGDRAPAREMTRYRSPPHGWGASDPRAYAARSPPERAGRFTDPSPKERMGFRGERDPRDRVKFEWSATDDYIQRERPHDGYLDRSQRHSGSPRGNWGNDLRDRSRSPPRNRPMKNSFTGRGRPDDYAADRYASRGRGHVYRPGSGPYPGEGRGGRRAAPRARHEDGY